VGRGRLVEQKHAEGEVGEAVGAAEYEVSSEFSKRALHQPLMLRSAALPRRDEALDVLLGCPGQSQLLADCTGQTVNFQKSVRRWESFTPLGHRDRRAVPLERPTPRGGHCEALGVGAGLAQLLPGHRLLLDVHALPAWMQCRNRGVVPGERGSQDC